MNNIDREYKKAIKYILANGRKKADRTGTGTISVFDYNMKFDLSEGFPILTSKKVSIKNVYIELLWFLGIHMQDEKYKPFGLTNIKYLVDNKCYIWVGDVYKKYENDILRQREIQKKQVERMRKEGKLIKVSTIEMLSIEEFTEKCKTDDEFVKTWGNLGSVYGKQWINWDVYEQYRMTDTDGKRYYGKKDPINQIQNLISNIKKDPDSRRLLVNAYNVGELDKMVLPPCHIGFQCYTFEMTEDERCDKWRKQNNKSNYYDVKKEYLDEIEFPVRKISLKFAVRSNDFFLGNPYNTSSYGLLLYMIGHVVNMIPHELSCTLGDTHLYLNHLDAANKLLEQPSFKLPTLNIKRKITDIFDFKLDDIELLNYKYSKVIKAPLSN